MIQMELVRLPGRWTATLAAGVATAAVLQGQDAYVRDLHQADGRRGVADLGVPAGRTRRCDAVGQDDEVGANRHVARVGVDVRVIEEDPDRVALPVFHRVGVIAGGQVSTAVQELLVVAATEQLDRHELVRVDGLAEEATLEQVDLRAVVVPGRQEPDGRPLPAGQVRHLGPDLYARVREGEPSCAYGARPEV